MGVVGVLGVKLISYWCMLIILDVMYWAERKEVSWEARNRPVRCKSMGPLVKLHQKPR